MTDDMRALSLRGVAVTYPNGLRALRSIDLDVRAGRCLAVAGESGSGKSTLARQLLGLNPSAASSGTIHLGDTALHELSERDWLDLRWRRIAITLQATTSLDPVMSVLDQIIEPMRVHGRVSKRDAAARVRELLGDVGLDEEHGDRLPAQLSGGQRRSVSLAIARACDPELLVLDEPTAGLDPIARRRTIELLGRLRDEGQTLIVCTHDIASIDELADDVAFIYRGWLAEHGPAKQVLHDPRSPYGRALLNAVPTLWNRKELRGIRIGNGSTTEHGCVFADRCTQAVEACHREQPVLRPVADDQPDGVAARTGFACLRGGIVDVLRAAGVSKRYRTRGLGHVDAVNGIDVTLRSGEVLGILGGNGTGKSTLAAMLAGLLEPDRGTVRLGDIDVTSPPKESLLEVRATLQLVQQDPFDAVSPTMTIEQIVAEPLDIQGIGTIDQRRDVVKRALDDVRLPRTEEFLGRRADELSGGQLQRVTLARGLVLEPSVLILDEPVSMLDPSEQAETLQLLKRLQTEHGLSMIFVSHDIAVIARLADRIVVVDAGRIVERTTSDALLRNPTHPVTRALLAASGADLPPTSQPPIKEIQSWTAAVS